MGRAPKVFCSYGSPDSEAVEAFAAWLREHGVDAWLDRWEVAAGDPFVAKIEQGLREAELVLVFLSWQSVDRVWHRAEVEAAIVRMVEDGIRVLPVKLDTDVPVSTLLGARAPRRIEEREAILESIHQRSHKPVIGPPPELWRWAMRGALEKQLMEARQRGGFGVGEAAAVEEALGQLLRDRVQWVERPGVCLASLPVGLEQLDDLGLPVELLRAPASVSPPLVRCELLGTETRPEHPSPRPEGGRIVLATTVPTEAMLDAMQQACWAGLHHVARAASLRQRLELDERGAFDPERDGLPSVSRRGLMHALGPRDGRPGAAMLLLACRVRASGLCLCDESGRLVAVAAEELASMLEPFASHLRTVVLMPVADEGAEGDLGATIMDAALALHRRGVAAVAAPRVPLPVGVLAELAGTLMRALLGDPGTLPSSLEAALARVGWRLRGYESFGRLDLRLYARATDGDDTRPLVIAPYRGLSSFEPEHARFYMGRGQEIEKVVARLGELEQQRKARLIVLVGASGVGKSSLAKAGVVPKLVGQRGQWVPVLTRPADDGIEQLEARVQAAWDGRRIVVVVDQLEEVYAEAGMAGAGAYLQRLWRLAQDQAGTAVVATLRVDALGVLGELMVDPTGGLTLERLASGRNAIYVYHLGADELRTIIVEPARHVGLELEQGLVDRLCEEALAEPGALPMLEMALRHLWGERQGCRLPASAYRDGLAGTLARQANRCIEDLSWDQQGHAWRILVRIATGPDVGVSTWRRRTTVQALQPERPERRAAFKAALEGLVKGRLVVTGEARAGEDEPGEGAGRDVPIELAHELLLRRWDVLKHWIEQARPTLQAIRELEQWVEEWKQRRTLLTEQQLGYVAQAKLVEGGDDLNAEMRRLLAESRRAVRRRKRLRNGLFAGTGVVAIVLAALSYFALNQRNKAVAQTEIAEQERDKANEQKLLAERRLAQAVKLSIVIGMEIIPQLERYPQVRLIVKELIEKLQAMQGELGVTDADLLARLTEAEFHLKRGNEALHTDDLVVARREYETALEIAEKAAQGYPGLVGGEYGLMEPLVRLASVESRAGNLARARELAQRSLQVAEALVRADQNDVGARFGVAAALRILANVEQAEGNLASARGLLQRALILDEELVMEVPNDFKLKRNLAIDLDNLARMEAQAGNPAGARDFFQRALQRQEELAKEDPDHVSPKRDMATTLRWLGDAEMQMGNLTGARDSFQRALAMSEELARVDPYSAPAQRDVAVTSFKLGQVEGLAGNLAGARDHFQRSCEMNEALVAADPHDSSVRGALSDSLNKLGEMEIRLGNLVGARGHLQRSLQVAEALGAKGDRHDVTAKRTHVLALLGLGGVESQLGSFASARDHLLLACRLAEEVVTTSPQSAEAKNDLSLVLERLGDLEVSTGNIAAARDYFQRKLVHDEETIKAIPDGAQPRHNLIVALDRLGATEARAGNEAAARDYLQRALQRAEEHVSLDPQSAEAKRDVSLVAVRMGDAEAQAGNLVDARDHLQRALRRQEELASMDPHGAEAKRDVATSLTKLADLERRAGNPAGSRDYFQRALDLAEELARADSGSAQAKHDLSLALNQMGLVDLETRDFASARARFQRSSDIVAELAKADPDNAQIRFEVARSHVLLVLLAMGEEDAVALHTHLEEAKTRLDDLAAKGQIAGDEERELVHAQVQEWAKELLFVPAGEEGTAPATGSAVAAPTGSTWEYTSTEGGFTIELPSKPKEQARGDMKMVSAEFGKTPSDSRAASCGVMYMSRGGEEADPKAMLDVHKRDANVIEDKDVRLGEHPGHSIVVQNDSHRKWMRVYVVDEMVYILTCGGPFDRAEADAPIATKTLDSFALAK